MYGAVALPGDNTQPCFGQWEGGDRRTIPKMHRHIMCEAVGRMATHHGFKRLCGKTQPEQTPPSLDDVHAMWMGNVLRAEWPRHVGTGSTGTGSTGTASTTPHAAVATVTRSAICVATTSTLDRVAKLHILAESWAGHLSVAMLTRLAVHSQPSLQMLASPDGTLPVSPHRITLSLVDDEGYLSPHDRFPTNMLRNVATEGCPREADIVLVLDIDFQLCCGSPSDIALTLERHAEAVRAAEGMLGVVIPAFEYTSNGLKWQPGESSGMPRIFASKAQLLDQLHRGEVQLFQHDKWKTAHTCDATPSWNASRWKSTAGETSMAVSTRYQMNCEPYLLLSRRHVPQYDSRFVGYGKNRASFHYELAARGMRMLVQPDIFLVHQGDAATLRGRKSGDTWMVGESCWMGFTKVPNRAIASALPLLLHRAGFAFGVATAYTLRYRCSLDCSCTALQVACPIVFHKTSTPCTPPSPSSSHHHPALHRKLHVGTTFT